MTTETSFKQAYGVLQKHSETLRKQSEPNIDELLNIVEESVGAFKVCKSRIAAVEAALEKALGSAEGDVGHGSEAGQGAAPAGGRGARDGY